ncbi:MAG: cyclic peptide export ABC transporter [Gammaproteobacteria bacterium]|nr:cyclic peptide export ABC transporter [Gammaproteobacteria bacterium]
MSFLWYSLRSSWRTLAFAACVGLVAGLGGAGLIALVNAALEKPGRPSVSLALAFTGLCLVVLLGGVVSHVLLVQIGQERVLRLRLELSRRILAAPLRQLQLLGRHRLLAALTEDIPTIASTYQTVHTLCMDGALVLGCLIYLAWLAWNIVIVVVTFIAVGVVGYRFLERRALRWLQCAREGDDRLYQHYRAITEGAKEFKMHKPRRQTFLQEDLHGTADFIRTRFTRGMIIYILANHGSTMLFYLVVGLVLFVLPAVQEVPSQSLMGYTLAILYMMYPLGGIVSALPALGQGFIASQKIDKLGLSLAAQTHEREGIAAEIVMSEPVRLQLNGVSHAYYHEKDDRHFMLGPIDLELRQGELIFVVGGNGSGKTTLAMLLLGLYAPEQGEIRLNGELITDANRDTYRQQFAAVFVDAYVFESLPNDRADVAEQAQRLLAQLQLESKVRIEDGRFSTLELSQGQRKRLALLSAILDDRPIYLFDEWAADQDPGFRDIFYTVLLPQMKAKGKIIVVITHDDRYYHLASRCIKLDSGRIVQEFSVDSPAGACRSMERKAVVV